MIIPGEPGEVGNRDVIIQQRYGGGLQRMNELAPSYDPLQYLLLFLAGEDRWSENLRLQNNQDGAHTRVSMAAYYAQKLHFSDELSTLHFQWSPFSAVYCRRCCQNKGEHAEFFGAKPSSTLCGTLPRANKYG